MTYEDFVKTTDISSHDIQFYLDGMNEESGEISGIFKRIRRGDYGKGSKDLIDEGTPLGTVLAFTPNATDDLIKEIGDMHWYTTRLLQELGHTWEYVEATNERKLTTRKEQDKIMGKGDNREV